jgi:uncharacterized protein
MESIISDKIFKENKELLKRLKNKPPKNLDQVFQKEHLTAFSTIDCLDCGNCCKTTSPMFTDHDIDRLAKHLKMTPSAFFEKYLMVDEDKFQVLKSSPCAFLGSDNYCSVYEARPKACREFPHTDRRRVVQLLDLTLQNTKVCPAVAQIVDNLKKIY